jgi:DNA-binding NarL/FixJ family response regulator
VISVAVVDDQALIREGLRRLLELTPDLRVVGEARDGEEGLKLLRGGQVQVALVDIRMPRMSGLDILRELKGQGPAVILLTTWEDPAVAVEGVALGARGFLLKDITLDQLAAAIRTVAAGGTMIHPAVTQRVSEGLKQLGTAAPPPEANAEKLTRRETEILRLVAAGMSNREIAAALGTAEGTIKNHASSAFAKLKVRDRTQAVLRAIELGLL